MYHEIDNDRKIHKKVSKYLSISKKAGNEEYFILFPHYILLNPPNRSCTPTKQISSEKEFRRPNIMLIFQSYHMQN